MALVASVNYREQQRADTVLVTEGTGFLGAHTIARLLAGGHQVRTTIRSLSRQADVEAMLRTAGTPDAGSVRYRPADLTADDGWTEAAPLTVLLTREEDWQAGEHTDAALRPTGEHSDMPVRFLAETTGASAEIAAALHVADGARVVAPVTSVPRPGTLVPRRLLLPDGHRQRHSPGTGRTNGTKCWPGTRRTRPPAGRLPG
jgi:nucleoside-diphosphate-sugar epimerase